MAILLCGLLCPSRDGWSWNRTEMGSNDKILLGPLSYRKDVSCFCSWGWAADNPPLTPVAELLRSVEPLFYPKCPFSRVCVFLAPNLYNNLQLQRSGICSELWTCGISLESTALLLAYFAWPASPHLFDFQGWARTHACQAPWPWSHARWNGPHPHRYFGGGPAAPGAVETEAPPLLQCKPLTLSSSSDSYQKTLLGILGSSLTQAPFGRE